MFSNQHQQPTQGIPMSSRPCFRLLDNSKNCSCNISADNLRHVEDCPFRTMAIDVFGGSILHRNYDVFGDELFKVIGPILKIDDSNIFRVYLMNLNMRCNLPLYEKLKKSPYQT